MSTFRTALGQEFVIERRLPSLGWRPRFKGDVGSAEPPSADFFGDDTGIFAVIGLIVAAIFLVLFVIPLLLFVVEVALVVALIIPITIFALLVGLKQHTVVLSRATGEVVDQRQVHGLIGSVRATRALKAAANAGAYPA